MTFLPENQYAIVCVGGIKRWNELSFRLNYLDSILFSKSPPNAHQFASINFETEIMENYHDGMIFLVLHKSIFCLVSFLSNIFCVIQHKIDADAIRIYNESMLKKSHHGRNYIGLI